MPDKNPEKKPDRKFERSKVRKAVIPVAGLGTRFLPFTKVVSKELLPIGSKPSIHLIVEELVDAGIDEIILVMSPGREQVYSYFQQSLDFQEQLKQRNKLELLDELRELSSQVHFSKAYQVQALGLGHAVLCAMDQVGNEPFLVVLPDDLIDSKVSLSKQLVDAYQEQGQSLVAVQKVSPQDCERYGILDVRESPGDLHSNLRHNLHPNLHQVTRFVEKPKADQAPSQLAIVGRYLFEAQVFDHIQATKSGALGEIQLTDAMNFLARDGKVLGYEFEGTRLDIGNPEGHLEAQIHFANQVEG